MPFFSVIVPCCNVGPYVRECLASVKAQSCGDFECIVSMEESTDNTAGEVAAAIDGDPRFVTVTRPRSGSASAPRNLGVRMAHGEYIVFLDGDDLLTPDALEKLVTSARNGADLIATNARTFREDEHGKRTVVAVNRSLPDGLNFPDGVSFLEYALLSNTFRAAVWFYCVRTALVRGIGIEQPVGRLHQDNVWSYRLCIEAKRFAATHAETCLYRKRPRSVTWKIGAKSVYDMADNAADVVDYLRTMEEHGYSARQLRAGSYYLAYIFGIHFLREGVFAPLNGQDCLAAINSVLTPANRPVVRRAMRRIRFSRRLELIMLMFSTYRGCFNLSCFAARHLIRPAHNLYGALKAYRQKR